MKIYLNFLIYLAHVWEFVGLKNHSNLQEGQQLTQEEFKEGLKCEYLTEFFTINQQKYS